MKRKNIITAVVVLIIFITSVFLLIQQRNPTEEIYPLPLEHPTIQKGLQFLKDQMDEQGCIQSVSTTAWAAIAIASTGDDLSKWGSMKQYLQTSLALLNESRATDWQRHCLAIIAFQMNPRNVSGIDIIEKIKRFYHNGQIGSENNIYDDIFGIITLYSSGEPKDETIENSINTILSQQDEQGGWGDVDTTAAAINALATYHPSSYDAQIRHALTYIKKYQEESGGFFSWGNTNCASTSWVLFSLNALEEKPTTDQWTKNGSTPIDYLIEIQQSDGSFLYNKDTSMNREWMTAYALLALSGGNFIQRK